MAPQNLGSAAALSSVDPNKIVIKPVAPQVDHAAQETAATDSTLAAGGVSPPSPALPPSVAEGSGQSVAAGGAAVPNPAVSPATPPEKGGEGGDAGAQVGAQLSRVGNATVPEIDNATFLDVIYADLPPGAFGAACTKTGDPTQGGWGAQRVEAMRDKLLGKNNNYLNCSSFYPGDDGSFRAIKGQFAACLFLMLDDVGTKVPFERLGQFVLSWLIETSPGNHQAGILLAQPITDPDHATRLLNALIEAGLCDPGASGPLTRWARLPVAINGKPNYSDENGSPFRCRLRQWNPEARYTPQEIVAGLQLELPPAGRPKKVSSGNSAARKAAIEGDDVWIPKASINPVIVELKARGLYKTPLGSGKHDITCPWVQEHTDQLDTGAAYFEPDDQYSLGGYCCQHSHRDQYRIRQLLEYLNIDVTTARHKPTIRVVPGELHRVVNAAERELAAGGQHYQFGGLIASVVTDPTTGDPAIVTTSLPALTRTLSSLVTFEALDGYGNWLRIDPPSRHTGILDNMQEYVHLSPLAGVVRQPYFRETDGALVMEAGYDTTSQRFGVFDARQFVIPEPTVDAARAALTMLEDLLTEFHFVAPTDKAAALSAIITACVRPSLDYAPAYHVGAPVFGSGKTYLCELIGAFAGPGRNAKVSYPPTSEEATKVILSLLLTSPAVVEFDDMAHDWLPHGTIMRVLTAEKITDRILGSSKTATVTTRTLFLGSGNNVGPVRDLLRRVLTIHLDPRTATPATMLYSGNPVDNVRQRRAQYVSAVLTIILAWRQAGSPRTQVQSIVTYGGAWTDYARQPLLWLGYPDPATALIEQVQHDPDADILASLMREWYKAFGSVATTVRKAVAEAAESYPDLWDAIREFPVEERGVINRSKLGWLLKKNANRIAGGFEFQKAEADGRVAWRVVQVAAPGSPPSPPLGGAVAAPQTGAGVAGDDDDLF